MSEAVGSFAVAAYSSLLPIAQVVFAITILVLGPMALFRRTRAAAGMGTVVGSYVFGLTTWFLGARVTFATYGWVGLFIGLLVAGVGVVPMAIVAAFFSLRLTDLGVWLIVGTVLTFVARVVGAMLSRR